MKKLYIFLMAVLVVRVVFAQTPQKMSYQAVIRNAGGTLVANQVVGMRITILEGALPGTVVYQETQTPMTNANGLVTLEIGSGSGFDAINWGNGIHFIRTETDASGGTSYTTTGTSQLMSVPYAFYARNVQNNNDADADPGNELQKISLSGTVLTLDKSGGSVTLPSSGGGDNWGTQVVKTNTTLIGQGTDASLLGVANAVIQPDWTNVQNKPAGFADGIDNVDDADNSISNEIQVLSIDGTQLTLSKNGGTVAIPGDNWGTQTAATDATLSGIGTVAVPLKIADNGVTSSKIMDAGVTTADLANNSVITAKIADNAVTVSKLPSGAASDKYLRGDGIWATPVPGILTESDPTWSGAANETADVGRAGRVGIGTTTPGALLHVHGTGTGQGNVLFAGQWKESGPGVSPVSGPGTRMMWYPDKAAFRAGYAEGNHWNTDSTGNFSAAMGRSSVASGNFSTALGSYTRATGIAATALGSSTTASGDYSTAMGMNTIASQWSSTAMGSGSKASGLVATAMGDRTKATGYISTALGFFSTASGQYSTAMGMSTNASGSASTAMGYGTNATREYSTAMGSGTFATGILSTAFGNGSVASGRFSTVMGSDNTAPSFCETVIGCRNTTYTPLDTFDWNGSDRLFVIGNGAASRSDAMVVLKNGNTGIGSSNPGARLEVAGQVKITGGSPGAGKVLSSDGVGLASWQTPSGFTLPYSGSTSAGGTAFSITNASSAAIFGEVSGTSGITYGIKGKVNSASGFSGYFTGGKFYVEGNTGIGTENPAALLHTLGTGTGQGNVLFAGQYKSSGAGVPPASGPGTRMMWYPDKASFRAGWVDGTQWDAVNTGLLSAAIGSNTTASGYSSIAMGNSTNASGYFSTTMGIFTTASGMNSTAMGNTTTAMAENSTAMGNGSIASGFGSTAMGQSTVSSGNISTAMGNYTTASGFSSTAMGNHSTASGSLAIAIGGGSTASGTGSCAIGTSVTAPSSYETAIGYRNTSYTPVSVDGYYLNDRLFVIGNGFGTSNSDAMTILKSGYAGIGTSIPEAKLHVLFDSDINVPQMLLTENASDYARLMFKNTAASTKNWTVAGLTSPTDANSRLNIYYANGSSGTDILAVTGDGKVGINTSFPTQALHVVGDAYKTNGGTSWATSSDIRLKNVLGKYTKGLDEIISLRPVRYIYKADNPRKLNSTLEQVGFVAQEVRKIFPEAVTEAADGFLDFNIHSINVAMVNAIKDLHSVIVNLEYENNRLKAENEQLKLDNKVTEGRLEKIETILGVKAEK